MENDNSQKELFEGFEAPRRSRRPRFAQLFQKTDFSIALTAEKLVFISIGIIMLIVVFFAMGIEKGKSLAAKIDAPVAPAQTVAAKVKVPAKVAATPAKVTTAPAAAPVAQAKVAPGPANISPKDKSTVSPNDKPYTIVAAAFLRQDFASNEAAILKAGGLDAFVLKSDPYYLACVGSFANKDSALKSLNKVRQKHRDAYVKLR